MASSTGSPADFGRLVRSVVSQAEANSLLVETMRKKVSDVARSMSTLCLKVVYTVHDAEDVAMLMTKMIPPSETNIELQFEHIEKCILFLTNQRPAFDSLSKSLHPTKGTPKVELPSQSGVSSDLARLMEEYLEGDKLHKITYNDQESKSKNREEKKKEEKRSHGSTQKKRPQNWFHT